MGINILWDLCDMVRRGTLNNRIRNQPRIICIPFGRNEFTELPGSFHNLQDDKKFQTAYCTVCNYNKESVHSLYKFDILQPSD